MKIFVVASIILISTTLSPPLLAADDENVWMKNNRRSIGVGVFYVEEDTELRISSDLLGAGTNVDFQDDLGLDEDDEAIRVAGHYRFSPRHRINFGFFDLRVMPRRPSCAISSSTSRSSPPVPPSRANWVSRISRYSTPIPSSKMT